MATSSHSCAATSRLSEPSRCGSPLWSMPDLWFLSGKHYRSYSLNGFCNAACPSTRRNMIDIFHLYTIRIIVIFITAGDACDTPNSVGSCGYTVRSCNWLFCILFTRQTSPKIVIPKSEVTLRPVHYKIPSSKGFYDECWLLSQHIPLLRAGCSVTSANCEMDGWTSLQPGFSGSLQSHIDRRMKSRSMVIAFL